MSDSVLNGTVLVASCEQLSMRLRISSPAFIVTIVVGFEDLQPELKAQHASIKACTVPYKIKDLLSAQHNITQQYWACYAVDKRLFVCLFIN